MGSRMRGISARVKQRHRPIGLDRRRTTVPDKTDAERGTRGRHPMPEARGVTPKQRHLEGWDIAALPYQNTDMGNRGYRRGTRAERARIKIDKRPARQNLARGITGD